MRESELDTRRGRLAHYRRIPSLREYLVVNHEERLVEHHTRVDDVWTLRDVRGDAVIELASVACSLPLGEIYLKVDLARAATV